MNLYIKSVEKNPKYPITERADKSWHLEFSPVKRTFTETRGYECHTQKKYSRDFFLKDLNLHHKNETENISLYT